jgi:hypothetical protein
MNSGLKFEPMDPENERHFTWLMRQMEKFKPNAFVNRVMEVKFKPLNLLTDLPDVDTSDDDAEPFEYE